MAYLRSLCVLLVVCCAIRLSAQSCPEWNFAFTNPASQKVQTDYSQHTHGGSHSAYFTVDGMCEYDAMPNTSSCETLCSTNISPQGAAENPPADTGYKHQSAYDPVTGASGSNGGSAQCGAEEAVAVRSCPVTSASCDSTVTLTGAINGIGGSVSYSASMIWHPTLPFSYTCQAHVSTASCGTPNPSNPPYPAPNQSYWVWNTSGCYWQLISECPPSGCLSPIIIDTDGTGFHLTSAAEGVTFDFFGDGHPIQIAWTAKGSTNGWLVMPESDGSVRSARDMFGNLTPQAVVPTHPPNGFAALALYDTSTYGGNSNGMIDPHDAAWGKLRVWVDANHDGVAQPGELRTLDELGIGKIDLRYRPSHYIDQFGNQFSYRGDVFPTTPSDPIDRKIFDVFLVRTH